MSESERSFFVGRALAKFVILGSTIVPVLHVVARLGGLIESRSLIVRVVCRSHLHQIHRALELCTLSSDGQYPWKTGAAEPREAWRDLGLLYPSFVDDPDAFICPGMPRRQRDESFTRFEKKPESIPFTPSDTTDAISYGYSFDARDDGAGSWVSDGSATRRVLADKKAGTTTIGPDLERTAHRAKGRNVANADGSTAWVAGPDAVDLDPGSDVVGTPDARDYTDWWSDPPCYGE